MANFVGKWELAESINFQEYMVAIGVEEEKRKIASQVLGVGSKMTHEFSVNGDEWTLKIWTQNGEKEIKFKLGQEFDSATLDGRPVKVMFNKDGDKLIETQKGATFESINERTVSGDELTMLMTGGGVTCTRKYRRV
ncbi:hypothetical protein CHS0354_022657 [Potamilus streckersoni]|uniref:Uncharacterized protein n=1 Tax=Potamilus streckersoni TaxID=2493646 RepID=A0AAE0WDW5_9BIVA|nr:hypothetical protein CHS0354_022657 [Potamilus streckersoni]